MGLTLMMKMTFNESIKVATSESPNLQTGVTNIPGHHNILHFGAWQGSRSAEVNENINSQDQGYS